MYVQKNLGATILFVDYSKDFDSIHKRKMDQILLAYGLLKETVAAIMMLYKNTKVKVRNPVGDTDYFDIVESVQQGDPLTLYLFIICLHYVLRTYIDIMKKKTVSSWQRKEAEGTPHKLLRTQTTLRW